MRTLPPWEEKGSDRPSASISVKYLEQKVIHSSARLPLVIDPFKRALLHTQPFITSEYLLIKCILVL